MLTDATSELFNKTIGNQKLQKSFLPPPTLTLNNYIHFYCEFENYTTHVDYIIFADMLLSMIKST